MSDRTVASVCVLISACLAACSPVHHLTPDAGYGGIAAHPQVALEVIAVGTDGSRVGLHWASSVPGCPVLDESFGGNYGGLVMTVDSFGGPISGGCGMPTLSVGTITSPLVTSDIDVRDRTAFIAATFPQGVLDKRAMTLRSHVDWQFAAGDVVVLGWSRPDDLVNAQVSVLFAMGQLSDTNPGPSWQVPATTQADALTFTVPKPASASGQGTLLVTINAPIATALSCVGATACSLLPATGASHDVTITQ